MTQIPLLEPVVLNEVVQFLQIPEQLQLSASLPRTSTPVSFYTWDVVRGTRQMAKFNVPNSEANIVEQHGRSQNQASLAYTREKKTFEPTTTMWIREVGSTTGLQNAEEAIMREINDLNLRVDNLVEYACWQALHGALDINQENVQAHVDYRFENDQFVQPAVSWVTATPVNIVDDVLGWLRAAQRKSRVALTDAWLTSATMARIFHAFAGSAEAGGQLLTESMKNQYYNNGTLPGFLTLNWHIVEGQYDDDEGNVQQFVADDEIIFTNLQYGEAMKIVQGPSADFGAGQGSIGKYMKTWEQEDPSARFGLLEYRFLPVITRPDQILVVRDVKTAAA